MKFNSLLLSVFYFLIMFLNTSSSNETNEKQKKTTITKNGDANTNDRDENSLKDILENAKDGSAIHLAAGIYIIDSTIKIINKSLVIYAYGCTIKMNTEAGYHALRFSETIEDGSYEGKFEWYGGTFDGNRYYQNSPVVNLDKESKLKNINPAWIGKGNNGLLTVQRFQSVIIKDIIVQNNAGEGIVAFNCKNVLYIKCTGKNGLAISQNNGLNVLNTGSAGHQQTYFKVRSEYECHAIWDSIITEGGSIGIYYSSNHARKGSLAVIKNCQIKNPAQDAIHIEHCENIILSNNKITGDLVNDSIYYRPKIHVGNECKTANINRLYLQNGYIDFRQGSKLEKCVVNNFTIVCERPQFKYLISKAITVKNGTVRGFFKIGFNGADSVMNVKLNSINAANGIGIVGSKYIYNCSFSNLFTAAIVKTDSKVFKEEINNCKNGIIKKDKFDIN